MKKYIGLLLAIMLAIGMANAGILPVDENAKENGQAATKSKVIGTTASGDWILQTEIVHYAKPGGGAKPGEGGKCYKLLGPKWKTLPVNYVINPTNGDGLTDSFVVSTLTESANVWDDATLAGLFGIVSVNNTAGLGYDGSNTMMFGSVSYPGAIAVTYYWSTMKGKEMLEYDIIFNDPGYKWGDATTGTGIMDLLNIAVHEKGHGVGLDDIYTPGCGYVTMYGYSWYGDIGKRDLADPDIAGLRTMYGP